MSSAQSSYAALDRPEVTARLFHPRKAPPYPSPGPGEDVTITVAAEAQINECFHWAKTDVPALLFFHGNGEIVSDYDDLGPVYNGLGINFLVVDYRGYGRSTGSPSVSAMMQDCHPIFNFTASWLKKQGHTGPLIVMGRSLGSASALELAHAHQDRIDGLIVESGFAHVAPLLRLLGIMPESIGFVENEGFGNMDKIKSVTRPTLIIHAEYDHIIPYSDGRTLFNASPATKKRLVKIPGANHNDIFFHGRDLYLTAIQDLVNCINSLASIGPHHHETF